MSNIEHQEKLDIKLTFFIGFASLAIQTSWALYDSQVPISLFFYIGSIAIVGLVMGLDNLAGVVLQPIMANVSDNTRTKWGRRMPYLMLGIPISALFFALISFETSLFTLLLFIFCYIVAMGFYRAQSTILLADFIQPHHRSKANSIINIMNALSIVVAAVISILLVDISLQLAFITVAILMIVSLIVLILTVNENEAYAYRLIISQEAGLGDKVKEEREKVSLVESFQEVLAEKDKSTILMLFAIFFIAVGWTALNALLSSYAVNVLGLTRGQAGGLIIYGAVTFLISAYPLAVLAEKHGRKLFMKIGLVIFIAALVFGFFFQSVLFVSIAIALIGIGYACVLVHTVVIIWELAPSEKKIGTYTGLYYVFMFSAEIFGPGLVGLLTDFTGWEYFFLNGALFLLIALIILFFVKRETAELTEEQKLAKEKAIQELK